MKIKVKSTPSHHPINKKGVDIGLLILRIGVGIEFVILGITKLQAGPDRWFELGSTLSIYGVHFAPTTLGFFAMFIELIGGALLILGVFMRTSCFLLLSILAIALGNHINLNGSFFIHSHALETTIIILSLFFIGTGKYTLPEWILYKRRFR